MTETFLNGKIILHRGDCLEVLATLPENSIDSCCTDPPYHLTSVVKRFGGENAAPAKAFGKSTMQDKTWVDPQAKQFVRLTKGFMGKQWDGGDIAQSVDLWRQVYRVLKPGAHLLAFGGTRTYHRMACAIEDAGFEIRDCIQWLYGSGFPKSHDVSKGIDRAAGAEREVVGTRNNGASVSGFSSGYNSTINGASGNRRGVFRSNDPSTVQITNPATDAARQWEGWGTALKPAYEPIVLARKPLSEKTVAANVLRWGTGAINVDGCRVDIADREAYENNAAGRLERLKHSEQNVYNGAITHNGKPSDGRWPANVIHDGSEKVLAEFPESGPAKSGMREEQHSGRHGGLADIGPNIKDGTNSIRGIDDNGGSAARFFYTSKADSDDRLGSKHPTVKPLDLMQYLVRLVTPKGGTTLDPFAGTGTTGEAAFREGMKAILIERELEYQADIHRRMELCLSGPDERKWQSMKAKLKDKRRDDGPLFGGLETIA